MNDVEGKPWRIYGVRDRLSDEYADILEAEFSKDYRDSARYCVERPQDRGEVRCCYDEAQALEVLSVEPGWIHGEKFYMLKCPPFEDEEEGCYVQDFGFGPYIREPEPIFWRSIIEDVPEIQKNLTDVFSPDFFLPGHKKPVQPSV